MSSPPPGSPRLGPAIRHEDAAAHQRFMGVWSQLAGDVFLDWLAPARGQSWLDAGCGTGAFTERVLARCEPERIEGVEPSEAQIAFARTRIVAPVARFRHGDVQSLPYPDDSFDVAVMPLAITFITDPARALAEMRRVVRPGGQVAAYGWDVEGGGWPYHGLREALRGLGADVSLPSSPGAAGLASLQALWRARGLIEIATREIVVRRTFADFDDYWKTAITGAGIAPALLALTAGEIVRLKAALRASSPADAAGRVTFEARANAVRGHVPA